MATQKVIGRVGATTLKARIVNDAGQYWRADTNVFESPNGANWSAYKFALTEVLSGAFEFTWPSAMTATSCAVIVHDEIGGTPATDQPLGRENVYWTGTALFSAAGVAQSGDNYTNTTQSVASRVAYYGTCLTSSASTLTMQADASSVNGTYVGCLAVNRSGKEAIPIIAYNGTTKVCTLSRAWSTTPSNGDSIAIVFDSAPGLSNAGHILAVDSLTGSGSDTPGTATLLTRVGVPVVSVSADIAAVKTDSGNLITRLGAWLGTTNNTVLGALRAIAAKAAGLTPADLSSGTTFDNTTDSLEAVGNATSAITILPISSTVGSGEVRAHKITGYQYARLGPYTFTINDSAGAAISLAGHSITFVVESTDAGRLWQVASCPVSGASNNIVTVSASDANMGTAGSYRYVLRDVTDDTVIARGEFAIVAEANVA